MPELLFFVSIFGMNLHELHNIEQAPELNIHHQLSIMSLRSEEKQQETSNRLEWSAQYGKKISTYIHIHSSVVQRP